MKMMVVDEDYVAQALADSRARVTVLSKGAPSGAAIVFDVWACPGFVER
jgi:hypothetical protein